MNLRGHHLVCLFGFRGRGYSEEFIKNMADILDRLRRNYNQEIKLLDTVDDICKCCPNCINNQCSSNKIEPRHLDKKVLSKIGLEAGSCYRASKVLGLIKDNIELIDLRIWCKECPWYKFGYCLTGLRHKSLP